jgi:hypothetical protein
LIGLGKASHRRAPASPANDRSRAAFLAEICELLWPPAPAASAALATTGSSSNLIVLPNLRHPRLVVAPDRRVAAAAVRRYGEPRSASSRWGQRGLSLLMRSGVGGAVLRKRVSVRPPSGTSTIEAYLSSELGQELRISMYLGAPRANRKPVLHLFTPDGDPVGVAKIGITPLARDLVRAERDALLALDRSQLQALRAPEVLRYGTWHDMPVMVIDALPTDGRRQSLTDERLVEAMVQVAGLASTGDAPLRESGWWAGLSPRLEGARSTPARDSVLSTLHWLESKAGATSLRFGAWHGDWTPWNMASTADGLLVWDWERFATGVPVGFDAMHCWLQTKLTAERRDPLTSARESLARAPELLAPFGVEADAARLTAALYLAELAVRHLADDQQAAGSRLSSIEQWLIPALNVGVATQ